MAIGPEEKYINRIEEGSRHNDLAIETGRIAVPSGCDDYDDTTRREIVALSRSTHLTPEEIVEHNRELSSRQPR